AAQSRRPSPFFKSGDGGAAFCQPKLRVNTPGDHFEREADRKADRIVSAGAEHAPVKEDTLHKKGAEPDTAAAEAPASVHETHTLQQQQGGSSLQRQPDKPAAGSLEARLNVIEQSGPATQARLDEIIRTGGPMPNTKDGAKVIGAAIIDVEGYQGPKEMRAIN